MKVKVSYKMPKDNNWHKPVILEITRVPSIGEHIHTIVGLIEDKLCEVKLVIHTPENKQYAAEIYGAWVEREDAINKTADEIEGD